MEQGSLTNNHTTLPLKAMTLKSLQHPCLIQEGPEWDYPDGSILNPTLNPVAYFDHREDGVWGYGGMGGPCPFTVHHH